MQQPTDTPKLADAYAESLPASRALYDRAKEVFPDGVTHDNRRMQPFPIYVEHAEGAYKWDVDGNRYIDYWMGHGALLFGHNPPHIRDSVSEAVLKGSHYGASHAPEVEWGEWVQRLVPCAERVRFTASGTEATHMALRLAARFHGPKARNQVRGPFPRLARGARDRRARPLHERTGSGTTGSRYRPRHRLPAERSSKPSGRRSPRETLPPSSWSRRAGTSAPSR